jgi:hypothetical protein
VTQNLFFEDRLTEETRDPDEEHELIRELRSQIEGQRDTIRRLTEDLPEAPPYLRRRIVRAMNGLIPLETQSFSDFRVSQDSRYLYHLVRSLDHPLRSDVFEDLKPLVSRDPVWLAGAAASALAKSYEQDHDYVATLLGGDRRDPVRVPVLKKLYDRGTCDFTEVLVQIVENDPSRSVRFHAAVLLVASVDRGEVNKSLPSLNLIESVRDHVGLSGFGAGGRDD